MPRKSSSEITQKKDFKSKKNFKENNSNAIEKKYGSDGPAKRTRSLSKDQVNYFQRISKDLQMRILCNYPNQLEDFITNKNTIEILRKKGVKYLFPIQEQCFRPIFEGKDLIGKDRTGSGKTLAFGIPVVERLRNQGFIGKQLNKGQKPFALIMLPTRELAIQVAEQFKSLSHQNNEFRVQLLYGGSDIYEQMDKLRNGVEIVIGTPGRIMDLYNRGKLSFSDIQIVCLDEADEMLNQGFVEDIQKMFEFIEADTNKRKTQNLLFSATIPSWMMDISRKYQDADRAFVDLIKNDGGSRTSKTVEHLAINCPYSQITSVMGDVILCYGGGTNSRAIIFVETKREANDILVKGSIKGDVQVLHGDIPQKQREVTFQAYKEGKVQTLVCTNVCARGLDIPEIDLVIQCEPPKDVESYIHRAGRTARAGRKGVCITFYNKKHIGMIERIEKKAQITMRRVAAPQPQDILMASSRDIASSLRKVNSDALKLFHEVAQELIEELGPEQALSRAIAFIAGVTEKIKGRSLLCSMEGYRTYICTTTDKFQALGYIWSFIRNNFSQEINDSIKGMKKLGDQKAIFDIPEEHCATLEQYIQDKKDGKVKWGHDLEVATELPQELLESNSNGSTGTYTNGSMKDRQDAKRNKKNLEVFIGGLPFNANEQQLADHFRSKGIECFELRLLYGDDGSCKGLGFALLKNTNYVQKALKLDGTMFGNRRLRVNMADKKPNNRR
ncbi:P-loop containing nucleoside triphosphate hydrolase [Pseudocohnilembus persalinus]|uniref:RNA helicase n=1 Tax=Pseudocohnilembus persalinus TaxID=266149 RepID=A0A0V0R2H8_PSEPJ|nr:P-loop containing nucleoside triphosphate hydrolase [Pseudocohnilembus persalinus]|eukprot:KRX08732.1 P-loop containing nucleoside triphosphate hydrolase [Pseudocohnilembus persalinus]